MALYDIYDELERLCSTFRWWDETDHMDKYFIITAITKILNNPQFKQDQKKYKSLVGKVLPVDDESHELAEYVECFFELRIKKSKLDRELENLKIDMRW